MAGVDLGGTGAREAAARLDALAAPHTVTLRAGSQAERIGSGDIGFRLRREETADRALSSGRGSILDALATPWRAVAGDDLQPAYAVARDAVRRRLTALAREVDEAPSAGGLTPWPELAAVAPVAGRRVDRQATAAALIDAFAERAPTADATVRTVPAPPLEAVERVARAAREYVGAGGLRLTGAGRTLELPPRALARLLAVERAGRGDVRLGSTRAQVQRLVKRAAAARDRSPRDARLAAPPTPVVFDAMGEAAWRPRRGDVTVTPARAGRSIHRERAVQAIEAAIRAREHEIALPVTAPAPRVGTAAARSVRYVVGTFTTYFQCCQPRVRNIELMAQAVDGTVVMPGEQLSLNATAGRRTRDRGFVPAPFIADGKIVPSVGGGVSQFSTTLYNAAYFAGLKLDAHQPHSFYIDRYPAGREATLDYDSIDLLWTNDTDVPILIRTGTSATSVTVTLYGDNGGRRVTADAGPRRPLPDRDFQITVTRTVRYGDGRVARQPYTTSYDLPPED